MDIFKLVGKISVDYADAVEDIEQVSDAADSAAESLENMGSAAGDAESPVNSAGSAAGDADGKFSTWKATLANLAASAIQGMITKCTDLAKSVVDLGQGFTATMSEVQAISGATDEQMVQLEATARQYGATTVFSATEAAEALKYMSLAGWSVEESTSALGGVLDLAAASGMELGQASDMVTDYLSAFGMEADKAAYFADMLAFAQSNSNTTAEQLGEAYRNCAANLNAAGQDVETVTSLLEAMANQGYKGSEAGTVLAAIMRDITNAMEEGAIKIGDTTVSVMDANGNFRDLTDILTDVEAATEGMGDAERAAALSTTFTADSTKGLNLIMNEGMEKVAGYEEALRGADGAASKMAATMNDNLSGDLANMNSAFEELKLKIFDGLEQPLRSAVQFVTNSAVPALTTLVENFDSFIPIIVGVTAAIIGFKAAMAISSIISAATTALNGMSVAQWALNAAMSANPIGIVVGLITGLIAVLVTLWNTNEDFRNAVIAIWESIKEAFSAAIEAISGFIGGLIENISSAFQSIQGTISSAWAAIQSVVSGALSAIQSAVQTGMSAIKAVVTTAWNAIKTSISTVLNGIKSTVTTVWNAIKATISTVLNSIKATVSSIWNSIKSTITSAVNAIKSTISSVFNAIKSTVSSVLNSIKSTFSSVWNGIKSTVSSAVNGVKSTISSGLNSAKSTVTSVLNSIKSSFSNIWNGCKSVVSGAINHIKGIMNFSWSLPHLSLPHISISGGFSINPPSVPHFSISWYKKAMEDGMIMNQPTIFGYDAKTNQFLGGGEAGSETVVGTENLMNMIKTAVSTENSQLSQVMINMFEKLFSILEEYLPEMANMQLVTDTGALVGELAPAVDNELGVLQKRRERQ